MKPVNATNKCSQARTSQGLNRSIWGEGPIFLQQVLKFGVNKDCRTRFVSFAVGVDDVQ